MQYVKRNVVTSCTKMFFIVIFGNRTVFVACLLSFENVFDRTTFRLLVSKFHNKVLFRIVFDWKYHDSCRMHRFTFILILQDSSFHRWYRNHLFWNSICVVLLTTLSMKDLSGCSNLEIQWHFKYYYMLFCLPYILCNISIRKSLSFWSFFIFIWSFFVSFWSF